MVGDAHHQNGRRRGPRDTQIRERPSDPTSRRQRGQCEHQRHQQVGEDGEVREVVGQRAWDTLAASEAVALWERFRRLEEAGAFAVEAEVIPARVMAEMKEKLDSEALGEMRSRSL